MEVFACDDFTMNFFFGMLMDVAMLFGNSLAHLLWKRRCCEVAVSRWKKTSTCLSQSDDIFDK